MMRVFVVLASGAWLTIATPFIGRADPAEPATGPLVEHFGAVYPVPVDSFNLKAGQSYRVLMDIGQAPDDPAALNRRIDTAARFLNVHVRNGIQGEKLELALVLHGPATRNALHDRAHRERYGVANGNRELLAALGEAGVKIYLCGQSAANIGIAAEDLLPQVRMAVSAMTVHVRLQQEGFQPILF